MKRKIIKIADKTLVMSLPTAWVQSQHIEKGSQVDVEVSDYKLIISPPNDDSSKKTRELDIKNVSERVLRWQISSLHKQGYDEIVIMNYNKDQVKIIEWALQTLFVGFMIKERTKLRIVIGQVAVVDVKEFESTLRRAFRLLNTQVEEFIEALENNDGELLELQINHEESNNKLTNFCERLLNKSLVDKSRGHFWYVVAWNLEKVSDNFKYLANYFNGKELKVSKETINFLKEVQDYIKGYYELFYEFSFDKLVKMNIKKKELEDKIIDNLSTMQGDENIVLHYLHMMLLQVADFSVSIIAIHCDD